MSEIEVYRTTGEGSNIVDKFLYEWNAAGHEIEYLHQLLLHILNGEGIVILHLIVCLHLCVTESSGLVTAKKDC